MITAEELLTGVDSGEILPGQVPDFTWGCDSEWVDEANGIAATTLTLTLASGDTITDSWETSDRRRGWDRLTTLYALRDADSAATRDWGGYYIGWTIGVICPETGNEIQFQVEHLAEHCADLVQFIEPDAWTRVVVREIERALAAT